MAIDFDQLRKDMEDGSHGPWLYGDTGEGVAILDRYGEEIFDCSFLLDEDCRRIARAPDLERIALAAEKVRKAYTTFCTPDLRKARDELFALLTKGEGAE